MDRAFAHNKNKLEEVKMKKKGLVVALLCVMGIATMAIGNANAAGWYTCSVSGCGATWADAYITVTDTATNPAFPANTTFVIDNSTGKSNQMYAAALTAFANSTNVMLYLLDTAPFSLTQSVFSLK
jgi:hypothetical protein